MFVITQFFGVWTTPVGTKSRRLYTIIEEVASFGAFFGAIVSCFLMPLEMVLLYRALGNLACFMEVFFFILVATEVFSWGSGTNYQLGTGNAHIQKLPCKVEALHGSYIKTVAASKFHSVAVSSNGELYTWGFGRGGRLGHPDIHRLAIA